MLERRVNFRKTPLHISVLRTGMKMVTSLYTQSRGSFVSTSYSFLEAPDSSKNFFRSAPTHMLVLGLKIGGLYVHVNS
jgi:hypothetical protein